LLTAEVDLGTPAAYSGTFTIAGTGMTPGKPVLVKQAVGPYTGKGDLADECEEQVSASGVVESATIIRVYWQGVAGALGGNVKFDYAVSA